MKTKVLKSVLPIVAVVCAIGLAFATETTSMSNPAYYDDPDIEGIQELEEGVDCPTTGKDPCLYNGFQLYADQGLSVELYEREQ